MQRLDAAISADGKVLAVWCFISDARQQVSLYDMDVIKKRFYEKKKDTYAMSDATLRKNALIATATGSTDSLYPNTSVQSIEVSNEIGTNKWYIYLTSGNENEGKKDLLINRFTITKKSSKISDERRVYTDVPDSIIEGKAEIEGCHIKGDELQFLLTPTEKEAKKKQYIVGIEKSKFSKEKAKM